MKGNPIRLIIALAFGALLGVGATIWFFTQASQHVTAFQPPGLLSPDDAPSVLDRTRIMELVCRDVLSSSNVVAAVSSRAPFICFLGIGEDQDPTLELLKALGDLPMSVRRYSAGKWEGDLIVDKGTGVPGLAVNIQRMWMQTQNEVHVRVRLGAAGTAGSREWICTVTRTDAQWKVTDRKPLQ
jgi:hypothetical protein